MIASKTLEGAIAVTRFGLGATPGELADAANDPRGWLKAQIARDGAEQPQGSLPGSATRLSSLVAYRDEIAPLRKERKQASATVAMAGQDQAMDEADQFKKERRAALQPLLEGVRDEIFARTRLATSTAQPFRERWTLFWANHFTVSTAKLQSSVLVGPFEREAIRPHVFGRFEDMLVASSTHPGMLMYLDQAKSAGPNSLAGRNRQMGLNENLGREIMELHTVGADAGYTQADVTEFARALTGYSIGGAENDTPDVQGHFLYRPVLHEPGTRTVMGRRYDQAGEAQARAVLADLAASPKTAEHLARKLAVHFVADEPPPALVARLRESYLASSGDLAHVATTLIDAQECWSPEPRKFKTPYEFVVSGYRAAGASPSDPAKDVVQPLTFLGQRPFSAPQPNGWSDVAADWTAPDALIKRLTWASRFSAYYAPKDGAPVDVAAAVLGDRLTVAAKTAIARAETRFEAFSILLMSPEFQRR